MAVVVIVETATGIIRGEWVGGATDTPPPARQGETLVEWPSSPGSAGKVRWNGADFVPYVPARRAVSRYEFALRFTPAERAAIRAKIAAGDPLLTDFYDLLALRQDDVNLESGTLIAGLAYMAGQRVGGQTISDPPVLTAERVAEIRA
jgi:hypothetical protein